MFATDATTVQLIVSVSGVLVALIGACTIVLTQGRRHFRVTQKIERGINHIDETPSGFGPDLTLGQLTRQGIEAAAARDLAIEGKLDQHILDNRDQHTGILARITEYEATDERIEAKVDKLMEG